MQLAFAVIPLIHYVSSKQKMAEFAIGIYSKIAAWLIAIIVVGLNIWMLFLEAKSIIIESKSLLLQVIVAFALLSYFVLLLLCFLFPFWTQNQLAKTHNVHDDVLEFKDIQKIEPYSVVAAAIDFGKKDLLILNYLVTIAQPHTKIILIHIVESASAKILGQNAHDKETRKDTKRLETYVAFLRKLNIKAEYQMGYRNRVNEIVSITQKANAELLIMGAHGHKGINDWIHGQTVDEVRHFLNIPVLVVK
jgi:manganese transport protein